MNTHRLLYYTVNLVPPNGSADQVAEGSQYIEHRLSELEWTIETAVNRVILLIFTAVSDNQLSIQIH